MALSTTEKHLAIEEFLKLWPKAKPLLEQAKRARRGPVRPGSTARESFKKSISLFTQWEWIVYKNKLDVDQVFSIACGQIPKSCVCFAGYIPPPPTHTQLPLPLEKR